MKSTGTLKFKPDFGVTLFHLGCNAFVSHPNCGLCFPALVHAHNLAGRHGR